MDRVSSGPINKVIKVKSTQNSYRECFRALRPFPSKSVMWIIVVS